LVYFGASKAFKDYDHTESTLVIVAALNEEEGIGPTIKDLRAHFDRSRILVVDGRSTDDTVKIAKDEGAVILIQKSSGKGKAIGEAIREIDGETKYVAFTDADFTYPAEYLPKMLKMLEQNPDIGMVSGNRFNGHFKLKAMRHMLYFGNRLLAFTHNLLNGVAMQDPLTGLRMLRAEVLRGWVPKSEGFDIEVELNHLVENRGYEIVEIPIHYRIRRGIKKLRVKHGFSIFKRILSESF